MAESENKISDKDISSSIFETIIFFDIFNYPLTPLEVWQNSRLSGPVSFGKVLEMMESMEAQGRICKEESFYFLPGSIGSVKGRKEKYIYADFKFRRAIKIARLFKFIPWIRMIAIGNLMGSDNLRKESDIDLFIITDKGRIWLTRFFSVGLIKILGLRPSPVKSENTICLSFFMSLDDLDLQKCMLQEDIYFIYWLAFLTPIYDSDDVYEKLIENNSWIKRQLPNWEPIAINARRNAGKKFNGLYYRFMDFFLGWAEKYFKLFQLRLLPEEIIKIKNIDSRVMINDAIIKTHSNDRREEYDKLYKLRIKDHG